MRKKYFRVSPEIQKNIVEFYLNDTNSVMCSGMKELKKIKLDEGSSVLVPKKILLYDLKNLYIDWVKKSNLKKVPCLAFFSQLRPKQCVFAGDPGTHNICVCQLHQNIKLKLAATGTKLNYREVISSSVCFIDNKNCMLHKCNRCPGKEGIREFLLSHSSSNETTKIKYTNWRSVPILNKNSENPSSSRVTIAEFEESFDKFIDNFTEDMWNITEHHFISFEQKNYLNQCRDNLNKNTGIIIMDFAENYSFISQDSTQGFYFNNTQASLFTVTLYYKNQINEEVEVTSYCVISDSTKHQAFSVNVFQEAVLNRIKIEFPWINSVIYFSDGAPTQFKNK